MCAIDHAGESGKKCRSEEIERNEIVGAVEPIASSSLQGIFASAEDPVSRQINPIRSPYNFVRMTEARERGTEALA